MALTRRGWGALGVVVVCVAMGMAFGWRSLLAIVVPLCLSVLSGLVATRRIEQPDMERSGPEDGFVGDTSTVTVEFDVSKPLSGTVTDEHGDGVSARGNHTDATVGAEEISYELTYDQRGVHEVGPLTLTVTDVLGLATRTFTYRDNNRALAYPQVYELSGASRSELAMLAGSAQEREREEFDRLREYQSGDSLRDVHWKSSAKRPQQELVVKEFVAEEDVGDVVLGIEGTQGSADEMAQAAASLLVHFLSIGIAVGLYAPGEEPIDPDAGADHRTRLFERLALVEAGDLPASQRNDADVLVEATESGVTVSVDGRETDFESLVGVEIGGRYDSIATEGEAPAAVAATEVIP